MALNKEYLQGKVKDGWLDFGKWFLEQLKKFLSAHEGKQFWITIVIGNPRSLGQNAFFHGPLIDAFVRATGDTDRVKWKGRLKEAFLRIPDGKGGLYTQGTSELTVGEFADFLQKCKDVLMDQHGGYLSEQENKQYTSTLSAKELDYFSDKNGEVKIVNKQTGEVLGVDAEKFKKEQEKIPW